MAYPSTKGTKKGEKALQPRAGVPLRESCDLVQVEELIRKHSGNVSHVADIIGTTRNTLKRLIDETPHLAQALKDARERQLDDLEKVVFERAQETNDTTLQLFILKTQGRHRGWDQSEAQNTAKDIATAAFDFIINKSKSP